MGSGSLTEFSARKRQGRVRKNVRSVRLNIALAITCLLVWQIAVHDVPTSLTSDDIVVAKALLDPIRIAPVADARASLPYDDQIKEIRAVQRLVLDLAPKSDPIPLGHTREPRDLVGYGSGLCYDRSRTIEKLLRYLGFTVRHVGIYAVPDGMTPWHSLITPGVDSHAVSEVLTSKGWLMVGSNFPWISVEQSGKPVSLEQMRRDIVDRMPPRAYQDGPPVFIFLARFTYVDGLYSRHGGFYPPYDGVPDVSLKEALLLSWRN
jgi:hypothetical protein